jgi:hypothetical protein
MLALIFVIFVCVMLWKIFDHISGGRKRPRGLGVQPCPYCYEPMPRQATICRTCMHKSKCVPIWKKWRSA